MEVGCPRYRGQNGAGIIGVNLSVGYRLAVVSCNSMSIGNS